MKNYLGETGELYGVKFLPYYMQDWKGKKIELFCKVLNALPKELASELEEFLIQQERVKKIIKQNLQNGEH